MSSQEELIRALRIDKEGDWNTAHRIVQNYSSKDACWIHGYLHRKEGDEWNAAYWYSRASKPFPKYSLKEEWEEIYNALHTSI